MSIAEFTLKCNSSSSSSRSNDNNKNTQENAYLRASHTTTNAIQILNTKHSSELHLLSLMACARHTPKAFVFITRTCVHR